MNVVSTPESLEMAIGDKEFISIRDLNSWRDKFVEENPDHYPEITRDDIGWAHEINHIYFNTKENIIYLQMYLICPICGERLFKYPDVEKFEKMKIMTEHLKDIAKKIRI